MTSTAVSASGASRSAVARWLLGVTLAVGAVDMAKVELARGSNADAKTLATNIVAAQQAEISLMKGLLAQP